MKINNQNSQYNIQFGSKKFPRYLYHLTSNANYKSIIEDGFINKTGTPNLHIEKGIYFLELTNFFKYWGTNKSWGYDDLQRIILRHIVKWINVANSEKAELVILKIPTSKLNRQNLSVRSLNRLFSFEDSNKNFDQASSKLQNHLKGKTPAIEAPLYKMRKEAIEYIYSENISVENVEQIGNTIHVPSLRENIKFRINPVKCIMQSLLKGTPEEKGLTLMK